MKPELEALLLCDRAFRQADTGSWHLIGVRHVIPARELPVRLPPSAVFASVRGFRGDATVTVVLRDGDGHVVQSVQREIPRLDAPELEEAFPLAPVELREGGCSLELLVGDDVLAVRSLRVLRQAPGGG